MTFDKFSEGSVCFPSATTRRRTLHLRGAAHEEGVIPELCAETPSVVEQRHVREEGRHGCIGVQLARVIQVRREEPIAQRARVDHDVAGAALPG